MFRGSRRYRQIFPISFNNALRWHKLTVILTLALYIGGVGSATFVEAAPVADETIDRIDISISGISNPSCANSSYEVQVTARVDRMAYLSGTNVDLEGGLGPTEIRVKATSSDTGVVDFHPNDRTASALDNFIGRGVDFELKTEAPGDATLNFKSLIQVTGEEVTISEQQPIKVVNCRFKVSITSILSGYVPSLMETIVSTVNGEIGVNLEGTLTGDAEVTWNAQQATPCLKVVQNIPPSTAKLEGSLNEDGSALTVHVNYDLAMFFQTNTITCAVPGSGSQQHQFTAQPLTFTVPITGGNLSQPYTLPLGEMVVYGTAIISVVPIESN
jgi:hypothetical protein